MNISENMPCQARIAIKIIRKDGSIEYIENSKIVSCKEEYPNVRRVNNASNYNK